VRGRKPPGPNDRPLTGKGASEGAAARRQKALDLRIAGASYRQIGQQLGVSHVTAYHDVDAALEELAALQRGKAEKLREIELDRCEKMTLGLWPKVRQGDEKAVRALVSVMDRRAKLLGLDQPSRVEHAGPMGGPIAVAHLTDAELSARADALAKRLRDGHE
jgi:hypothetical protein